MTRLLFFLLTTLLVLVFSPLFCSAGRKNPNPSHSFTPRVALSSHPIPSQTPINTAPTSATIPPAPIVTSWKNIFETTIVNIEWAFLGPNVTYILQYKLFLTTPNPWLDIYQGQDTQANINFPSLEGSSVEFRLKALYNGVYTKYSPKTTLEFNCFHFHQDCNQARSNTVPPNASRHPRKSRLKPPAFS